MRMYISRDARRTASAQASVARQRAHRPFCGDIGPVLDHRQDGGQADAPDPQAIPWLLVTVTRRSGNGKLNGGSTRSGPCYSVCRPYLGETAATVLVIVAIVALGSGVAALGAVSAASASAVSKSNLVEI